MKNNFLKFTTISWKLTILYASIFSLVLIVLSASIVYGIEYFLVQQAIDEVETTSTVVAQRIAGKSQEHVNPRDPELVSETIPNEKTFVKIVLANGVVINVSKHMKQTLPVKDHLNITQQLESVEKHLLVRNVSVHINRSTTVYVQVLRDLAEERHFIELLSGFMAIADLIGILLSVLAGYIISRRMLNPIDKITRAAQSISISDLKSRIDVGKADDEITRLELTFNEMIGRLQLSFEKQNQFVSDASHELKTPISIIQGYINLMDRWGKDDRDTLQECIYAIKKETENMRELIGRLLFLASGDSDSIVLQKEEILIRDLLAEICSECELIAPRHRFLYQVQGNIVINADWKMLKQMLRALLDNSIKFTPEEGMIQITAEEQEGQLKLIVTDTGIGIPQKDWESIFTRFYRVDKARGKESGGSGLGLAIVKWIVDAHGGQITAESTPGQGSKFIIYLPCE